MELELEEDLFPNNNQTIQSSQSNSSISFPSLPFLSNRTTTIGIRYLWVESSHRNQGISFEMIELIRKEIFVHLMCGRSNIAWTSPTRDGMKFIERYLREENKIQIQTQTISQQQQQYEEENENEKKEQHEKESIKIQITNNKTKRKRRNEEEDNNNSNNNDNNNEKESLKYWVYDHSELKLPSSI